MNFIQNIRKYHVLAISFGKHCHTLLSLQSPCPVWLEEGGQQRLEQKLSTSRKASCGINAGE